MSMVFVFSHLDVTPMVITVLSSVDIRMQDTLDHMFDQVQRLSILPRRSTL